MKKYFVILLLMGLGNVLRAGGTKTTPEEYIATYKDIAMREMKLTGIPASITLAQGLLESSNGNSDLAITANNHFGIKCKSDWTGGTYYLDDDAPNECFRKYSNAEESYIDHSAFLVLNKHYSELFTLEPTDYKAWARGLKKAGYATLKEYPDRLINLIERYHLDDYDKGNQQVAYDDRVKNINQQRAAAGTETASGNAGGSKETKSSKATENRRPAISSAAVDNNNIDNELTHLNGILAYEVKKGDTYATIADNNQMMRWQIHKYNDLGRNDALEPGTVIYLKPKHRKASEETYVVKNGESMYYISQLKGIKLKRLYKLNLMKKGQEPKAGESLSLRHKRSTAPQLAANGSPTQKMGVRISHKPKPVKPEQPKPEEQPKQVAAQVSTPTGSGSVQAANGMPAPKQQQAQNDSSADYHVVARGETFFDVAGAYHVPVDDLKAWNNLADWKVSEGQRLRIKQPVTGRPAQMGKPDVLPGGTQAGGSSKSVKTESTGATDDAYYTVQAGETLYSISRKTGTAVKKIQELNNLKDNSISVGQKLKIKE